MTEPKIVQGQITHLDLPNRKVVVKDKEGILHALSWLPALDPKMEKEKQWFFVSAIYEGEQMSDCHYWKKPEDWPVKQNQYPGKPQWQQGKPRNEKLIVLQSSLKAAVDLFQVCTTPDTQDYKAACELVVEMAIKMTNALMKEGAA